MKTARKVLLLVLCAALLVSASVMGTMAYLTSKDTVTNTFTVGNVQIDLWETENDADGGKTQTGNQYHLLPGKEYAKNPTVTIKADSEEAYVRMMVEVTYMTEADAVLAENNYQSWFDFSSDWNVNGAPITTKATDNDGQEWITRTYEYRYKSTVTGGTEDFDLNSLFTKIDVPDDLTNAEISTLNGLTIDITAQAIQADGFVANDIYKTAEDAAWASFPVETATQG